MGASARLLSQELLLHDIQEGTYDEEAVIGYYRFSTEKQAMGFPRERQVASMKLFCLEHDLRLIAIYSDEAVSGTTMDRPGLQDALAFARANPGTRIVMESVSRGARGDEMSAELLKEVKRAKARIVPVNLGEVGEGIIRQALRGSSQEFMDTCIRLRNGKEEAIILGIWMGVVPYGYRRAQDGRIYPDSNTEVVRLIFDLRLSGKTNGEVAHELNLKAIPTPGQVRGLDVLEGFWTTTKVAHIVARKAYKGVYEAHLPIFDFEKEADPRGRTQRCLTIAAPWMQVVSEEGWASVQATARTEPWVKAASDPFLLSGVLKCESCGHSLAIQTSRGKVYARCRHRDPNAECREIRFDYALIETMALDTLAEWMGVTAETAFSLELLRLLRISFDRQQRRREWLEKQIARREKELDTAALKLLGITGDCSA